MESNYKIENYSEPGFWRKIARYSKVIGRTAMEKILLLYYALESENCGIREKSIIYGALAYLVSPIDAIPDLTPFLGYTDDFALIASALIAVVRCIDDEVRLKTQRKLEELF